MRGSTAALEMCARWERSGEHEGVRLLEELSNQVAPASCAGCNAWDTTLCEQCSNLAQATPRHGLVDGNIPMRLVALGAYESELRRIILAAKHERAKDLAPWLFRAGYTLGQGWLAARTLVDRPIGSMPLLVVPAPSQWTRSWRGLMITPTIARGAATAIVEAGIDAVVAPVLSEAWGASQAGLSGAERRAGRESAITARVDVRGANCVIVDDVVTTGATMLACRDALERASGTCFVGLALAQVARAGSYK